MTAARWEQIRRAFEHALQQTTEERAAVLARLCGEDADLRAQVERLLAQDGRAPAEFLRPPEVARWPRTTMEADGLDPLVGTKIGHYQIERVIASGGMGTVYLARQDRPQRAVALKLMRPGVVSRGMLRRFEFESQILGSLRHSNIAQVYEAGTHGAGPDGSGGVPYFALEYIPDAQTIADYSKGHELDTRERLMLFAQVCDAVQHGHQKGIIHRDLKPANILVNGAGQPKIIDFGVARATDADMAVTTMQTHVGELVGTLQYMSPEQCAADPHDLDTRSDVYSLGVVLYELLCGELPYDVTRASIQTAARIICEQLPTRPSAVDRKLRGDVETIVLKALEKDREKRYASAAALADDIRRYLKGEPIEARPPTAWTRGVHWIVRHPVWITAAVCALFVAVTGVATLVTVWFVNARPARAVVVDEGREARLLSLNGQILRAWRAPYQNGVGFAELIPRPDALGGGRLLLLGFLAKPSNPYTPGLEAYDADGSLERPRWEGRLKVDDIPQSLVQRTDCSFAPETFGASRAMVADVFGDTPGEDEIVVVHQHMSRTHGAVRVYDLRGNVLYQVWLDCCVAAMYWMEGPRLLVLAGQNGEAFWEERGEQDVQQSHPRVVFALRPERGFWHPEYVVQEAADWDHADPSLRPAWYKCLLPAEASSRCVQKSLAVPNPPWSEREFVAFDVSLPVDGAMPEVGIGWILGKDGEPVAGPVLGDTYRRNQMLPDDDPRKLPAIDWRLGSLPPIRGHTGETPVP